MSDTPRIKAVRSISHEQIHFCLARRPDSDTVYCGASDAQVYAIDFAADEPKCEAFAQSGHASYVTGAAVVDEALVTGGYDRKLVWWNLENREPIRSIEAHDKWIRRVVGSPDGRWVASVADDMRCRLWDSISGELQHDLAGHEPLTPQHFPSMLFTCCFSSDGRYLATADKVGHVAIWETASGNLLSTLDSPEHYTWDGVQRRHSIGGIRSLAFSPDDRLLVVGGIARIGNVDHLGGKALVHVFDWQAGERTHKFEHDKHNGLVEALYFFADGRRVLGAGGANEGLFLLIDLDAEEFVLAEKAPMHIHDLAASEEMGRLYVTGYGSTGTWDVA